MRLIVHLGKLYSVKISKRNGTREQAGMRDDEIQILIKFCQHPNIITLKDIFIEKECGFEIIPYKNRIFK